MILLDTHVWIWASDDPARISEPARRVLDSESSLAISVVSCWEVAMLISKKRLQLRQSPAEWIARASVGSDVRILPLTRDAAILAGDQTQLTWEHQDPADRFIAATAITQRLVLITADQRIQQLAAVQPLW